MRLFRRSKRTNTTAVPAEIQEYYNAEQRERVGLAWLIAIISLVVSLAVIFGMFFGGRYIYRTYIHKSKSTPTSSKTNKPNSSESGKLPGETPSSPVEDKAKDNNVTQPSSPSSTPTPTTSTTTPNTQTQNSLTRTGPDSTEE